MDLNRLESSQVFGSTQATYSRCPKGGYVFSVSNRYLLKMANLI